MLAGSLASQQLLPDRRPEARCQHADSRRRRRRCHHQPPRHSRQKHLPTTIRHQRQPQTAQIIPLPIINNQQHRPAGICVYTTSAQRRCNIDVEPTLYKRHVPAGRLLLQNRLLRCQGPSHRRRPLQRSSLNFHVNIGEEYPLHEKYDLQDVFST